MTELERLRIAVCEAAKAEVHRYPCTHDLCVAVRALAAAPAPEPTRAERAWAQHVEAVGAPPPRPDAGQDLVREIDEHFRKGHDLGFSATWAQRQEYDSQSRYWLERAIDRIAKQEQEIIDWSRHVNRELNPRITELQAALRNLTDVVAGADVNRIAYGPELDAAHAALGDATQQEPGEGGKL